MGGGFGKVDVDQRLVALNDLGRGVIGHVHHPQQTLGIERALITPYATKRVDEPRFLSPRHHQPGVAYRASRSKRRFADSFVERGLAVNGIMDSQGPYKISASRTLNVCSVNSRHHGLWQCHAKSVEFGGEGLQDCRELCLD